MSRLWDTPNFWARSEADELLRDFPNTDVATLAASFEHHPAYDGDPQFARDIIAELGKRADAGLRFWPEPADLRSVEREVGLMLRRQVATIEMATVDEDEAPGSWWKRM